MLRWKAEVGGGGGVGAVLSRARDIYRATFLGKTGRTELHDYLSRFVVPRRLLLSFDVDERGVGSGWGVTGLGVTWHLSRVFALCVLASRVLFSLSAWVACWSRGWLAARLLGRGGWVGRGLTSPLCAFFARSVVR